MVPSRNINSAFATHILYKEINDINVFIEDTDRGAKKLFIELISRALPLYRIEEVFSLGGRQNVLKKHQEYLQGKYKSENNNIFIIDGDLYLFNQNIINYKGLLGLNKYCIENYLIDEKSIIEFLYYEDSTKNRKEIKQILKFNDWCQDNLVLLYLFMIYSISHNCEIGLKTTSYKVTNIIKNNTGLINKKKTVKKILDFKNEILTKIDKKIYKELRNQVDKEMNFDKSTFLSYISGKDYLIPLLILRMKEVTTLPYKKEVLNLKLAKECDCSYFRKIKDIMI